MGKWVDEVVDSEDMNEKKKKKKNLPREVWERWIDMGKTERRRGKKKTKNNRARLRTSGLFVAAF